MTDKYRQAARTRKFVYLGLIAALFISTLMLRGVFAKSSSATLQAQANALGMTELNQGKADLTGSAVQLMLTGSRGVAICGLWLSANEKQRKHEWNKLEMLVTSITTLQPHFITPWMFQSWNLAYNVSVENDRLGDMYFYISRGIGLLAKGEDINHYNPDMRYFTAFYYQNKFTVSDKVTTLRCLLQLSCMPPEDRDYRKLQKGQEVDEAAFEEFCKKYPQLVRRMRERKIITGKNRFGQPIEQYLCETPHAVVDFLKDNRDIPSRYVPSGKEGAGELNQDRLEQFPVITPSFLPDEQEELSWNKLIPDNKADAILVSRGWFHYANEAAPPQNGTPNLDEYQYRDPEHKHRRPRQPALIIFLQGPPRAQTYFAERLASEGWFVPDEPWEVDAGYSGDRIWFHKETVILPSSASSLAAWLDAATMWRKHGKDTGLFLDETTQYNLNNKARRLAEERGVALDKSLPHGMRRSDLPPELQEAYDAHRTLDIYNMNRRLTKYDMRKAESQAESTPEMAKARKLFYLADWHARKLDTKTALATYEEALALWRKVLQQNSEYRKTSDQLREQTYDFQVRYQKLLLSHEQAKYRGITRLVYDWGRLGITTRSPFSFATLYGVLVQKSGQTRVQAAADVEPDRRMLLDFAKIAIRGRTVSPFVLAGDYTALAQTQPYLVNGQPFLTNGESPYRVQALVNGIEPLWLNGPFDGLDDEGKPWVEDVLKNKVLANHGLTRAPAPKPGGMRPGPPTNTEPQTEPEEEQSRDGE